MAPDQQQAWGEVALGGQLHSALESFAASLDPVPGLSVWMTSSPQVRELGLGGKTTCPKSLTKLSVCQKGTTLGDDSPLVPEQGLQSVHIWGPGGPPSTWVWHVETTST